MLRRIISLLVFCLSASGLAAQSVHWQSVGTADSSDIVLVFENCEPDAEPRIPSIAGVTFTPQGTSSSFMRSNGVSTQAVSVAYHLRRGGAVTIPEFSVSTNRGNLRVPAFTVAAPTTTTGAIANSTLTVPSTTVWAGEVFPLTYRLSVSELQFIQLGSDMEWSPLPLVAEEWSKPQLEKATVGGQPRQLYTYRTRVSAKAPGRISVSPAQQLINVQSSNLGLGFGFARPEQLAVTSTYPDLEVKPLPGGAPAGFNGAVGKFALVGSVVPQRAAVGEPITWTLTLSGTGNWPDIPGMPQREVSNDFKVVPSKAKRAQPEGKLFDGTMTEDVVLVPSRPGTYTLGPVAYSCFDPATGTYRTLSTDPVTVTVTGTAAANQLQLSPPTNPSQDSEIKLSPPAPTPPPAAAPGAIPNAPLAGSGSAFSPVSQRTLVWLASVPAAALALFWFMLAVRRAGATDPLRVPRNAHRKLSAVVSQLEKADGASRPRLLLDWQHQAGLLWNLPHAAPPASALGDPAWARLWAEADRALYSSNPALPADWTSRARTALEGKRVRAFAPSHFMLPRNLFPFLMLAAAIGMARPAKAADAVAEYQKGNFAAAEKVWRDAVRRNPTDWIARHNLALALIQLGKPAEAAAHATVAFAQNPGNPSVRLELQPTVARAGYTPDALATFIPPGRIQEVAQFASPAVWQAGIVLSATLAAVALGLWLARAYGWRNGWTHPVAATLLLSAALLGAAAFTGIRAYGNVADPRAVIAWRAGTLRSIPTEADSTQQTSALPAGNVAVVDNTFLNWTHLKFTNGQTGWVRKDDLVGIWK